MSRLKNRQKYYKMKDKIQIIVLQKQFNNLNGVNRFFGFYYDNP